MFLAACRVPSKKCMMLICLGGLCIAFFALGQQPAIGAIEAQSAVLRELTCIGCHSSTTVISPVGTSQDPCDYCHNDEVHSGFPSWEEIQNQRHLLAAQTLSFALSGRVSAQNRAEVYAAQAAFERAGELLSPEGGDIATSDLLAARDLVLYAMTRLDMVERVARSGKWVASVPVKAAPVAFTLASGADTFVLSWDEIRGLIRSHDLGVTLIWLSLIYAAVHIRFLKRHRGPPAVFDATNFVLGRTQRFTSAFACAISVFYSIHSPIVEREFYRAFSSL